MNLNFLGTVITISLSEILAIMLILVGVLIFLYVVSKYFILKKWYKKCPKCGGKIIEDTRSYRFSSSPGSETYLKCVDCKWEKRIL